MSDDRAIPRAQLRVLEALLFASDTPLDLEALGARLPADMDVTRALEQLRAEFADRGVNLVTVNGKWALRTAPDLAEHLKLEKPQPRRLSRAAMETLAIIAYHQPVTRAEIEDIRGVALSRGTLELLLEAGWIKPGRRRNAPGRPITWVSTEAFLDHFGLEGLDSLPGVEDLKAAGLLDSRPALGDLSTSEEDLVVPDEGEDEGAEEILRQDHTADDSEDEAGAGDAASAGAKARAPS